MLFYANSIIHRINNNIYIARLPAGPATMYLLYHKTHAIDGHKKKQYYRQQQRQQQVYIYIYTFATTTLIIQILR